MTAAADQVIFELEEQVVGAMLVSDAALDGVLGHARLRADHLLRQKTRLVLRACAYLDGQGEPVDTLTVANILRKRQRLEEVGGTDWLNEIASKVINPGAAGQHASKLIEAAAWRAKKAAGAEIMAAAQAEDDAALSRAESKLQTVVAREDDWFDAERQADEIWEFSKGKEGQSIPWGKYTLLTARSPLRRGTLSVLSAYSNTGKSTLADELLDYWHSCEVPCALLSNEGRPVLRFLRRVQRHTLITAKEVEGIENGALSRARIRELSEYLGHNSWPMQRIVGYTASEVANVIRRHGLQVVVVDLLNRFPIQRQNGLDAEYGHIVNVLADAAEQANCAVILVAQLNRSTADGSRADRRQPTMWELKGSADIENAADIVLFVHRPRVLVDGGGWEMGQAGELYTDKVRDGELCSIAVKHNPEALVFDFDPDNSPLAMSGVLEDPEEVRS